MKKYLRESLNKAWIRASIILLVFQIIFFYPIFFKGEVVTADIHLKYAPYNVLKPINHKFENSLNSDQLDGYFPKLKIMLESLKKGESIVWENNSKLGSPRDTILYGHYLPDYLGLVLPVEVSLTIHTMLKVFLGSLSLYFLLRAWGLKQIPSIAGPIIYAYSGYNIAWMWGHASTNAFILPFLFLCTTQILRGKYKFIIPLSLGVALSLSTGFVAGAGYSLYLLLLYSFAHLCYRVYLDKKYLLDRDSWNRIKKTVVPYLLLGIAVLYGLSLVAFLAESTKNYLDFIDISYRQDNSKGYLQLSNLIQLFIPYYNGGILLFNKWFGPSNYFETSGYIGMITFFFYFSGSLFALLKRRKTFIFFLFINLASISIVYRIGPTLDLINDLPVLNSSSNTRLLTWFGFSGSILAAYGFDSIHSIKKLAQSYVKRGNIKKVINTILLILLIIISIIVLDQLLLLKNVYKQFIENDLAAIRVYKDLMLEIFLWIWVCALFLLQIIPSKLLRSSILMWSLLAIVFSELFVYGLFQVGTISRELVYPETESIRYLMDKTNELDRVLAFTGTFGIRGTEMYYDLSIPFDHDLYTLKEREMLSMIFKDPSKIWLTATAISVDADNIHYGSELLDILNIKYLVFAEGETFSENDKVLLDENFSKVFEKSGDLTIYENRAGASITHLKKGKGKIKIAELSNIYEKYLVSTEDQDVFYVSNIYYPNWKVKVNGEQKELLLVDDVFRGVEVNEGENEVEFSYEPVDSYKYGKIYSVLSLLIVSIFYVIRFNFKRK